MSAAVSPSVQQLIDRAPPDRMPCLDCGRLFKTHDALLQHRRHTHDSREWLFRQQFPKDTGRKGAPICPKCGNPSRLSQGKFGLKAECCGLWSWKGKPLVSRETHAARIMAHEIFDRTWKSGSIARKDAYKRLAAAMQMTRDECHISLMTAEQAHRVITIMRRHFDREG